MNTRRRAMVGALLMIIGAATFWTAEGVTAQAWSHPAYSFRRDVISDLGDPVPHDFLFGHTVNSPRYFVMNFGLVADGILFGVAVFVLSRVFPGRGRIAILATGAVAAGGLVVVSIFHEQSVSAVEMAVHWLGAFLILFVSATIFLVGLLGGRVGVPRWHRTLSCLLGVVIFLSFMSLVTIPPLAVTIGAGAMERTAMWGALLWQVVTGIALLFAARRLSSGSMTFAESQATQDG